MSRTPFEWTDEPDASVADQARARLVHGLLITRHELQIDRERRVQVAMQRISRSQKISAHMLTRIGGIAAVAALVVAGFIISPQRVNAADRARAIAVRERASSDRRVMFILEPPNEHADRPPLTGTLDIRDATHMVLTLRMPDGATEIRGQDGDTAWSISPDGEVHTHPADRPWPAWIMSPRDGLMVDMAEMLETGLLPGWSWSTEPSLESEPGTEHLSATRTDGPPREPNRIDLVIDSLKQRPKRMELSWPQRNTDQPRRPLGKHDGPPPHHQRPEGPDGPGGPQKQVHDGIGAPMGPPSRMTLLLEPPVQYTDDWFTAARQSQSKESE